MTARGKGGSTEVMSTNEIEELQSQRQDLEQSLRDGQGFGDEGRVNEGAIKKEIAFISQKIVEGTPGKLTDKQKDSLVREEAQLEEKFLVGLPSKYEMDHPAKCPGAVRKHMKWLSNNEATGAVARYRQIQRTLRPGEEKSIESLRKDR